MSRLQKVPSALRTLFWLGVLSGIEAALRLSTLPSVCRRLGIALDLHSAAAAGSGVWPLPRRYEAQVRALLRASRWWPFGDTCLRRCLLLGLLLRREHPVLRIGIRRDTAGSFGAHSWLEVGDATLDPSSSEFTVLHGGRAA